MIGAKGNCRGHLSVDANSSRWDTDFKVSCNSCSKSVYAEAKKVTVEGRSRYHQFSENNFGYEKSNLLTEMYGTSASIQKVLKIQDTLRTKSQTPKQLRKPAKKVKISKEYMPGHFQTFRQRGRWHLLIPSSLND